LKSVGNTIGEFVVSKSNGLILSLFFWCWKGKPQTLASLHALNARNLITVALTVTVAPWILNGSAPLLSTLSLGNLWWAHPTRALNFLNVIVKGRWPSTHSIVKYDVYSTKIYIDLKSRCWKQVYKKK
jgi:hypothetical protein